MSNPPVISIVDRLPPAVSNRGAVAILESFLADARAGQLVSVAVAGVTSTGVACTAMSNDDGGLMLLGAVTRLQQRIGETMGATEIPDDGPPQLGA